MRPSEIVERLRTKLPSETWANRVFGVTEFERAINDHRSAFPSMFVTYRGSTAANQGDRNGSTLIQTVTENVDIYVMLDNKNVDDTTGLTAVDQAHDIRNAILLIMNYWNPDVYDENDQGFQYNEFRFTGDEPFSADPERYIHKLNFDIQFNIDNLNQGIGSSNPEELDDLITIHGTLEPTFFDADSQPALEFDVDLS